MIQNDEAKKINVVFEIAFEVRLANLIIKVTLKLGIFVVLGNPGSKVAWRCWSLNPNPQILSLMP